MRMITALWVGALLIVFPLTLAGACTVFVLDDGSRHYYGSNFDWHAGGGYLLVNQRGLEKQGWPLPHDPGRPVRWQSKFGSMTFSHFGQGFPKGGMNEAGLVIEGLILNGTKYEPPDERPYIGSTGELKQYLLDTCATVGDAVERLAHIRLATYPWAPGIHFMVADATGDCAVVEFLAGRMKIYRGQTLPMKVLANQAYAESGVSRTAQPVVDGEYLSNAAGRVGKAAARMAAYPSTPDGNAVTYAMETLEEVSAGAYTKWQVVYDQQNRKVYWQCIRGERRRWIDMSKIDFRCGRPLQALPIQTTLTGEVNPYLAAYTPDDNRRLVYEAIKKNRSVIPIPEELREAMWQRPQRQICMNE